MLYTQTALAIGMRTFFKELENLLEIDQPINFYLAGGMAMHLYTANRVTANIDIELDEGTRFLFPNNFKQAVTLEDGRSQTLEIGRNYNPRRILLHEDHIKDSIPLDLGLKHINVRVLSPIDLAVSKIVRLSDKDKADIAALAELGLISSSEIEHRAIAAMEMIICNEDVMKSKIRDAVNLEIKNE